jgi:hypothetical protein
MEEIIQRIVALETLDKLKVDKLIAIENLLKKIETCLIGGVGEDQIGLVSQVREDRKILEDLKIKVESISNSCLDLLEERKRVKWALRGVWSLFVIVIGYWLKYGK